MNYRYLRTNVLEMESLITEYVDTLTGVMDDFVENHILNAEWYNISINEESTGFFTLFKEIGDVKITSFFLKPECYLYAQEIFKEVLTEFHVSSAFVLTCDELFLSLCMDNHKNIKIQAYMFSVSFHKYKNEPKYSRSSLVKVLSDELQTVRSLTGDFFDEFSTDDFIKGKYFLYCLKENEIPLGYGIIVPNKIQKKYWACGMITIEKFRNKGVGRSIQTYLADICRENNAMPISGCWYYNILSKKTIESAGRYTKTRLLNVLFE